MIGSVLTLASVAINAYICINTYEAASSSSSYHIRKIGSELLLGWTLAATMLNIVFAAKYWEITPNKSDEYLAIPFYVVGGIALLWMWDQRHWGAMLSLMWALVNSMISYRDGGT